MNFITRLVKRKEHKKFSIELITLENRTNFA
jgi:hypothetical protein